MLHVPELYWLIYGASASHMRELYQRLEQIFGDFRSVFSQKAPFRWFVLLVWGIALNTQPAAVISDDNALDLGLFVANIVINFYIGFCRVVPGIVILHSLLGNFLECVRGLIPNVKSPIHGRF